MSEGSGTETGAPALPAEVLTPNPFPEGVHKALHPSVGTLTPPETNIELPAPGVAQDKNIEGTEETSWMLMEGVP